MLNVLLKVAHRLLLPQMCINSTRAARLALRRLVGVPTCSTLLSPARRPPRDAAGQRWQGAGVGQKPTPTNYSQPQLTPLCSMQAELHRGAQEVFAGFFFFGGEGKTTEL